MSKLSVDVEEGSKVVGSIADVEEDAMESSRAAIVQKSEGVRREQRPGDHS